MSERLVGSIVPGGMWSEEKADDVIELSMGVVRRFVERLPADKQAVAIVALAAEVSYLEEKLTTEPNNDN